MTELHLNGLPAVLPQNLNIKVNHENVYLTAASQYTLDIELPLQGCPQNLAIFGHINRIDARRRSITLQALLTASGKVILKGSALITSITRRSVKVQLLAGNSEFNFFGKGEGMYINEMDYSKIIESSPTYSRDILYGGNLPTAENIAEFYHKLAASYPTKKGIYLPIYNETEDCIMNDIYFVCRTDLNNLTYPALRISDSRTSVTSYQPYLCSLIQTIIENMNYTLIQNDLENTVLSQIIVCTKNNGGIKKSLPHWTVNEFFRNLEDFLGVVLVVDDVQYTARLIQKKTFFKNNTVHLTNIVDDFEVEIDNDADKDKSCGRVGYANNNQHARYNLSQDILETAEVISVASESDLNYRINTDEHDRNYIYEWKGTRYIHWTKDNGQNYYAQPVDQARPRPAIDKTSDSRSRDLDVELKFVPARIAFKTTIMSSRNGTGRDATITNESIGYPCLVTEGYPLVYTSSTRGGRVVNHAIQEFLENDSLLPDKNNAPDIIEVAFNNGYDFGLTSSTFTAKLRIATVYQDKVEGWGLSPHFSFELNETGQASIYSLCHNGLLQIDKTAKRCIRFLHPGSVDPKQLFVIRGKRFVCEKIERQIDSKGMQPLVTGYFYEVSE